MCSLKQCLHLCIVTTFCTLVYAGPNSIPTKEEQANLLNNVQEVFEEIRNLVLDEGASTDTSVADDVEKIVLRAQDKLELVEELALLKLSCQSNKVCTINGKSEIQNVIDDGKAMLKICADRAASDVKRNSGQMNKDTVSATSRGQSFLDELRDCSKKNGLSVISCYKNIIATDVIPVKNVILRAIDDHKEAHKRTVNIRQEANDCVDETLQIYQDKVAEVLVNSLTCK